MKQDKVISLIGLAVKAGRAASGEFSTEKAVKSKKAELVVVAADASDNTKKMFRNMCTYYEVPYYEYGSKENLGHGMGKMERASLAILDSNFSAAIVKQIRESEIMNGGSKYGESQDQ